MLDGSKHLCRCLSQHSPGTEPCINSQNMDCLTLFSLHAAGCLTLLPAAPVARLGPALSATLRPGTVDMGVHAIGAVLASSLVTALLLRTFG